MKVLIVVDMQKDFIDGVLGTKEAQEIVENVILRIKNSHGELILFTQDTHCANYLSTQEGRNLPVVHCVKDSEGWKINEGVKKAWRENENKVISQELNENTFEKNAFGSTALVEYLKKREGKITEIELLGLCTDICVISNAIILKNYLPEVTISVNEKCCAGVTPQSHTDAINAMRQCQINII
jgi:nicotinamidase-related amidase